MVTSFTATVVNCIELNLKIMKKITFLFAFFTAAMTAQTFPAPYCEIADPDDVSVEEITEISFGGVTMANPNATDILVDLTAISVPVAPGQSYVLKVYGNTYGNFDTNIVAFIDWNDNGILDDSGEIYAVGTLTNSEGDDGIFVETTIVVPATATSGTKRVRITKTYTDEESVAIVDPCAISFDAFGFGAFPGYGQAVDFNLAVGALSSPAFDAKSLSIYPIPAKNSLTIAYTSAIENVQIYNQLGQEVYARHNLDSEATLDVSNLAAGVYFLKLFSGNEAKTIKIVKE